MPIAFTVAISLLLEWPAINNLLINTISYCMSEQLKACRSMKAFDFLVNGWVNNIVVVSCHKQLDFYIDGTGEAFSVPNCTGS